MFILLKCDDVIECIFLFIIYNIAYTHSNILIIYSFILSFDKHTKYRLKCPVSLIAQQLTFHLKFFNYIKCLKFWFRYKYRIYNICKQWYFIRFITIHSFIICIIYWILLEIIRIPVYIWIRKLIGICGWINWSVS